MPTISSFFGIAVRMYYREHAPPHFHVYYNEHAAEVEIASLKVLDGRLPKRALALVLEWAAEHREELEADWQRASNHEPLQPISPLE